MIKSPLVMVNKKTPPSTATTKPTSETNHQNSSLLTSLLMKDDISYVTDDTTKPLNTKSSTMFQVGFTALYGFFIFLP
jgi:hypothetical protein